MSKFVRWNIGTMGTWFLMMAIYSAMRPDGIVPVITGLFLLVATAMIWAAILWNDKEHP